MTSRIVDYLVKSILFFCFDIYFILNPIILPNPREDNEQEPTFLEELATYILDE